ncbi:MAG: transporter [Cyanobium sp.]
MAAPRAEIRATRAALGVVAGALLGATAGPAAAQMYGPRQFWPAPVGTEVLTVSGIYTSSNTVVDTSLVFPNLDIDTIVLAPSYSRFFGLGEALVQASVALPYAWADVAVSEARTGLARNPRRDGLADAYGHLTVGLLNAPALAPAPFGAFMARENPGVVVMALAGVFAPTGAYDTDRVVNIGTNRWTFRAGVPITARLSNTWAPGRTTTFEVLPTLDVFTPNNDPAQPEFDFRVRGLPVGAALTRLLPKPSQTNQDPLAALEMHLTHDLSRRWWVSLDSYSKVGGATAADGQTNDNQQLWTALGGTVGASPWTRARLALTAGGVVAGNTSSPDGWLVRLQFQQSW